MTAPFLHRGRQLRPILKRLTDCITRRRPLLGLVGKGGWSVGRNAGGTGSGKRVDRGGERRGGRKGSDAPVLDRARRCVSPVRPQLGGRLGLCHDEVNNFCFACFSQEAMYHDQIGRSPVEELAGSAGRGRIKEGLLTLAEVCTMIAECSV